ncbi:unnamed protein product [Durusdinium trenchii]|uniref:Uncharacterized protein n=2 Tax=Durusdinium trenchii TaxID=1381693 RepID=A0ABP0R6P2_9DINO
MVPGEGLEDVDPEEAKLSLEELQLESDIRALEMEISIMDMKRQIEVQEEHLENWQQVLSKDKAGRLQCEKLREAQEELAQLRAKCAAIEAQRPPRLPSPTRAAVEQSPRETAPEVAPPATIERAGEAKGGVPGLLPPQQLQPLQEAKTLAFVAAMKLHGLYHIGS